VLAPVADAKVIAPLRREGDDLAQGIKQQVMSVGK